MNNNNSVNNQKNVLIRNTRRIKQQTKKIRQLQRQITRSSRIPRALRKRIRRNNARRLPAATTQSYTKQFRILYQDGNTVKVTGRDLIYKIPDELTQQLATNVITVIPANPAYWIGTRIAALAQGYQNYRPVAMKIHYVPQCAVTQQGNIIAGTLWDQAPTFESLQQSLRTSNGGLLTQCYKPATSVIRMKTNLQYNLYRMAGQFDQQSNPFIYMAMAIACNNSNDQPIIPGYFYVTWSFILKNPIGQSITYLNSGLTTYDKIDPTPANKTVVYATTSESNTLPCGAIIQLEDDDSNDNLVQPKYNNSDVTINVNDIIWQFSNTAVTQATNNATQTALTKGIKQGIEEGKIIGLTKIINYDDELTDTFATAQGYVAVYTDDYAVNISLREPILTPMPTESVSVYTLNTPALLHQDFGLLTQTSETRLLFNGLTPYLKMQKYNPNQK